MAVDYALEELMSTLGQFKLMLLYCFKYLNTQKSASQSGSTLNCTNTSLLLRNTNYCWLINSESIYF